MTNENQINPAIFELWLKDASWIYEMEARKRMRKEFRVTHDGRFKVLIIGRGAGKPPLYYGDDYREACAVYNAAFESLREGEF